MVVNKNRIYKYIFFLIISLMTIFNGGNSNLIIQINFIIISFFFLFLNREKNYQAQMKTIFFNNKIIIYFYFLFIIFIIFQTIPLPLEWIKVLSPEKYNFLNKLNFNGTLATISLNSSNSFFSLLNYVSLFLFLIIFKSLFRKTTDIFKFYYFIVSLGALTSSIAIYLFLIGNPDFWILTNSGYKQAATGFFINRTVFSCFLVLCFFCGIEYLKLIDDQSRDTTRNFFKKIYVRIFILLITIGIITSFSRLGNFLFISLIAIQIAQSLFTNNKKNKLFLWTLILIVIFDVLILGFYFGSEKLFQRYLFLKNDINQYIPLINDQSLSRGNLSKFAVNEIKNFIFFGYGGGGFEYLLKINYKPLSVNFASHAHSDLIEFIGEYGVIGSLLIFLSILFTCIKNNIFFILKNIFFFYFLFLILIFDFSLHIPIIQFLLIILFSIKYKKYENIIT